MTEIFEPKAVRDAAMKLLGLSGPDMCGTILGKGYCLAQKRWAVYVALSSLAGISNKDIAWICARGNRQETIRQGIEKYCKRHTQEEINDFVAAVRWMLDPGRETKEEAGQ